MAKKLPMMIGLAFLIFFIAYKPTNAALVAKTIGQGIKDIALGFGDFFSQLVS